MECRSTCVTMVGRKTTKSWERRVSWDVGSVSRPMSSLGPVDIRYICRGLHVGLLLRGQVRPVGRFLSLKDENSRMDIVLTFLLRTFSLVR